MRFRYSTLAAAVALALGTSAVGAAGVDDIFTLRGYGTVGGLYSTQDKADYVHDVYAQDEGAGYTDEVSLGVDSRTALQLDANFTERFSAVIQVVSESMYNNSWNDEPNDMWTPSLEWANLSYRVTDNLTVRGGRIVMPFLMGAEYQKVGYASHWMRTPTEVYGTIPYSSLDGGDIAFKHKFGSVTNTLRGYIGSQESFREAPLQSFDADMFGFIDTVEVGALTLRASFANFEIAPKVSATDLAEMAQLAPLAAGLAAFGATDAATQVNFIVDATKPSYKDKVKYYAVGATYDVGHWFAMAEGFKATGASNLSAEHTSGYISGGVRLNKWTPYATVSMIDTKDFAGAVPTATLAALTQSPIPQVAGGARALLAGVNQINASVVERADRTNDQTSVSLGMRWDAFSNVAVKAQYDYVMLPKDSGGMFINHQPGFEPGKDVSLFGLSVDFVF